MPTMTRKDVLRLVTAIFSDRAVHVAVAERCGIDNYVTSAKDGSDDQRGNTKLKGLWEELDMPAHRTQILDSAKLLRARAAGTMACSGGCTASGTSTRTARKSCALTKRRGFTPTARGGTRWR